MTWISSPIDWLRSFPLWGMLLIRAMWVLSIINYVQVWVLQHIFQGSWRHKLRTKFKNLRRPNRAQKAGIVVPPPPKRLKKTQLETPSPCTSDLVEYEKHITFLQRSFHSRKWSMASMFTLLEDTAEQRRHWIHDENPSVSLILEKFPCFIDPRIVSVYTWVV
jgi:hypothetical protein